MTIAFASFLAGSLLSMLMPVLLLIALAAWHVRSVRHVAKGDSQVRRATQAAHASPAPASGTNVNPPSGDPPLEEV